MQTPHAAPDLQPSRRWTKVACIALAFSLALAVTQTSASHSRAAPSIGDTSSRRDHAHDTHTQVGIASVYARMLNGRVTASGEKHDGNDFTAAHRTLPMGSQVRVTNLANHRSVVVRINDRGPRLKSRVIDLSPSAAAEIGLRSRGRGVARVRLDVLPAASPDSAATDSGQVASMNEKQVARASKERAVVPDTHQTPDVQP